MIEENKDAALLEQEHQAMIEKQSVIFSEKKKKFPMNVIEFVVGVVLLFFCFSYLANHPAEKSSIVSGLDVIVQKVRILISRYTSGKADILERKFAQEKSFHEVVMLAEDGKCLSAADIKRLQDYEGAVNSMGADDFEKNEYTYQTLLQWYYTKVRQHCDQQPLFTGATK